MVFEREGERASGASDGEVFDRDDLTAADCDEVVRSARLGRFGERGALLDWSITRRWGSPSGSDGWENILGGRGEVDADEVACWLFEDGGDDAVLVDKESEVRERTDSGISANVDVDTLNLVVEDEEVMVDTDEQDGRIHVGVRKSGFAREDALFLILDDVDCGSLIHDDEVNACIVGWEEVSAVWTFGVGDAESLWRNDNEVDAFIRDNLEGDLLINRAFDV